MQKGLAAVLGSFIGRRVNDFGKKSRLPGIRFGFPVGVLLGDAREDEQDTALRGQAGGDQRAGFLGRAGPRRGGRGCSGCGLGGFLSFFFPISNFFSVLFYSLFFSKPFSKRILRTIKYKPNTITTK